MAKRRVARSREESQFTAWLVRHARLAGWLVYHPASAQYLVGGHESGASRVRSVWLTPHMGDSGFPDLVLVRPPRVIFAELKRERGGRITRAQHRWGRALLACSGVEYYVWRPSQLSQIVEILSREDSSDGL